VSQQKEMLTWVLDHKLLSAVKPNHWMNQKDVVATSKIVGNVKVGLHFIQESKSKNQLVAKHATLSMCVSTCVINILVTRTTHILGLHRCNIVVAIGKRALIDTSINLEWATKTTICCALFCHKEQCWWVDQSRVSPN
jgi:hypothetical protein